MKTEGCFAKKYYNRCLTKLHKLILSLVYLLAPLSLDRNDKDDKVYFPLLWTIVMRLVLINFMIIHSRLYTTKQSVPGHSLKSFNERYCHYGNDHYFSLMT